ncbi:serine hydrolase, partial [Nonomuraea sp. NPDC049784]|uniref:serine hydrolase n=1 Tax=Nonomuraea sp. NPDC049784 TaxID=3154361 RepID=UPI0033F3A6AF
AAASKIGASSRLFEGRYDSSAFTPLRDLAHFMITMSDNAATDVLLRRVGLDRVNGTLAALGLRRTRLIGGCAKLFQQVTEDIGEDWDVATQDELRVMAVRDPARTTAGTPREITTLLSLIWRDQAGPPEACAEVRKVMGEQIWPHRLAAGFPDEVKVSGKTGTLWGIRNESGVVEYPDGKRYAVAVFVRSDVIRSRLPAADAAIGCAARLAVDRLR